MIKYNNNKIGILLYSNDSASQVMCVLRLRPARCPFVLYRIIAQFPVFLVKRLWLMTNLRVDAVGIDAILASML